MTESPHSRLFVRTAPAPPLPPTNNHDSSPHESHVLSRLSALIHPNFHLDASSSLHDPHMPGRTRTAPPEAWAEDDALSPTTFVDRDAIKVLIVTWNMGESLPKGDLSVLFGEVPPYHPATDLKPNELPKLAIEDKHPYHLVVVAGQECPTLRGVPLGLGGGGLMKGVSVRLGHRKDKDDKDKDKKALDKVVDKDKDKDKEEAKDVKDNKDPKELLAPVDEASDESEDDEGSSSSPLPPTSGQIKQGKGWSAMLDDWFCGPPKELATGLSSPAGPYTPSSIPSTPTTATHSNPFLTAPGQSNHAQLLPNGASPSTSPRARTVSPLNHSYLPHDSPAAASDSSEEDSEYLPMAVPMPKPLASSGNPQPTPALPTSQQAPGANKDLEPPTQMAGREGCYVHLVKERLMGIFFSIYVYRGCEHLVEGVDKDYVTAGLAGGRVGNKGGIGISVKLAGHRFLFVNSHLAAHASRVDARVANIAKINSELNVDCFLPKDDPRAALPDLTDRFDTVFWCGDLNFRLNVSRLHAEWLVEKKKYSEMLMWDQLRALMKDPSKNPLPGFEEHTIDFAPTFKYDVWRSIKTTNRELRRSLRRRGTLEGHSRRPSLADIHSAHQGLKGLSGVPEIERADEETMHDAETGTISSRRSIDSTSYGSYAYSAAGSVAGTDADGSDNFPNSVDASAYGSRHRALEAAFKEKTKSFFGKIDKVLGSSPGSMSFLGRHAARHQEKKHSHESAPDSRRMSISSSTSYEPRTPVMDMPDKLPFGSPKSAKYSFGGQSYNGPRRPSVDATSLIATSPNQQLVTRKPSALRRTFSGRSVRGEEARSDHSHDNGIMEIDEQTDYREGVYDSSKKQRVPSWCDRVLWKTHIVPDPVDLNDEQLDEPTAGARAMSRISNAFSHLRMTMTHSTSLEPHEKANFHVNMSPTTRTSSPTIQTSQTTAPVSSPIPSPSLATSGINTPRSGSPTPKQARSGFVTPVQSPSLSPRRQSDPQSKLTIRTNSGGLVHAHPLLGLAPALTPIAKPKMTYEPAVAADEDRSPVNKLRPRANSETGHMKVATPTRSQSLSTHVEGIITPPPRVDSANPRRISTGSLQGRIFSANGLSKLPSAERQSSGAIDTDRQSSGTINADRWSSGTVVPPPMARHPSVDASGFTRFIKDLPNWWHSKTHAHENHDSHDLHKDEHHAHPRRHRQGEVVCLHYGTIDDQGMRQLEGRSDHRPAIFSAAVYI